MRNADRLMQRFQQIQKTLLLLFLLFLDNYRCDFLSCCCCWRCRSRSARGSLQWLIAVCLNLLYVVYSVLFCSVSFSLHYFFLFCFDLLLPMIHFFIVFLRSNKHMQSNITILLSILPDEICKINKKEQRERKDLMRNETHGK